MDCNTKDFLLDKFQRAVTTYRKCVEELQGHVAVPPAEFALLLQFAERARQKAEKMRNSLHTHVREHQC